MPLTQEERLARFEALSIPEPNTGCWIWTGDKGRGNYGFCWTWGRREQAHRAAYREFVGPISKQHIVRHRCDNPACVNPDHLRIGTQADNIADKVSRNRQAKGERHGSAKLSEQDIRVVRDRGKSRSELSRRFDIHVTYVDAIRRGKVWGHVE